jgi:hypothetical protein
MHALLGMHAYAVATNSCFSALLTALMDFQQYLVQVLLHAAHNDQAPQ